VVPDVGVGLEGFVSSKVIGYNSFVSLTSIYNLVLTRLWELNHILDKEVYLSTTTECYDEASWDITTPSVATEW